MMMTVVTPVTSCLLCMMHLISLWAYYPDHYWTRNNIRNRLQKPQEFVQNLTYPVVLSQAVLPEAWIVWCFSNQYYAAMDVTVLTNIHKILTNISWTDSLPILCSGSHSNLSIIVSSPTRTSSSSRKPHQRCEPPQVCVSILASWQLCDMFLLVCHCRMVGN